MHFEMYDNDFGNHDIMVRTVEIMLEHSKKLALVEYGEQYSPERAEIGTPFAWSIFNVYLWLESGGFVPTIIGFRKDWSWK